MHKGRLELTWTNKDQALLTTPIGGYEWVPPTDYRVSEVRLLHTVEIVGDVPTARDQANLLIRGDALHGLRAINELPEFTDQFLGKVRLAYIDPPFNTGQAFTDYDDALEHSVWLTMMRDRIRQIRSLLAPDGSIWVHLDDVEVHRCRAVLDEEFGQENFVAEVVWQKADSPRNSAKHFSVDQDTLLVYAKNAEIWRPNRLTRTASADAVYSNPDDDPRGAWFGDNLRANKPYSKGKYTITGPTGRSFTAPRYWRISEEKLWELDEIGEIYWGRDGSAFPTRKRYLSDVSGMVPRTLWKHETVGSNRTASTETKALFGADNAFDTPKPERLMQRIIHLATDPGDLVLDCFAGSGTTAAVAHKMRRRWVTIEASAETVATYTLPRLTQVVEGTDRGGISTEETPTGEGLPDNVAPGACREAARTLDAMRKADALDDVTDKTIRAVVKALRDADRTTTETVWKGGGGFVVIDIGPSMFDEVEGRVYLSDWAANGALAEASAAQLGYVYALDPPFCGHKGKSRLAVIDGLVSEAVVRLLVDALPAGEKLVVAGTALDPAVRDVLRSISPGSSARKVPESLLDDYRQSRRSLLRLASVLDEAKVETEAS